MCVQPYLDYLADGLPNATNTSDDLSYRHVATNETVLCGTNDTYAGHSCTNGTMCFKPGNETSGVSSEDHQECRLNTTGCLDPAAATYNGSATYHDQADCSYRWFILCASFCDAVYQTCNDADDTIFADFA